MLRIVLALAVLGIVMVTLTKMMKSQLPSLSVTGAPATGASQPGEVPMPAAVSEQFKRAIDAGVAARASQPTP